MNVSVNPWVCDEFVRRRGSRRAIIPSPDPNTRLHACYDLSMHTFDPVKSFNYKTFRSIQSLSGHRPGIDDETALVACMNSNATVVSDSAPKTSALRASKPSGSYICTQTLVKHMLSKQEEDRINFRMRVPFDAGTMMLLLKVKLHNNELREVRGVLITGEDFQTCVCAKWPSSKTRAIVWQTPYQSVYFMQPLYSQADPLQPAESLHPESLQSESLQSESLQPKILQPACTLGDTVSHIIQAAAAGRVRMPHTQYTAEHSHLNAFTPIQVLLSLSLNAVFEPFDETAASR